ncbi:MAG: hypothetical protein U1E51_09345 [Candidatus Binatia bacterium]|nr:hypothetical protein [Candidatus Binatia bacterium]
MKKMLFSLMLGILLIASFDGFGQEQVATPVWKDGEFWRFRVTERDFIGSASVSPSGIYEISHSGGKLEVFHIEGDQKRSVSGTERGYLTTMLGEGNYVGGQHLKFPMSVGEKWAFSYRVQPRGGGKAQSRSAEVRVTGTEEITAQAGAFRVFKLVREDSAGAGSGWVFTYYYSPDTRSIVRAHFDFSVGTGSGGKRDIELIRFGSAR